MGACVKARPRVSPGLRKLMISVVGMARPKMDGAAGMRVGRTSRLLKFLVPRSPGETRGCAFTPTSIPDFIRATKRRLLPADDCSCSARGARDFLCLPLPPRLQFLE